MRRPACLPLACVLLPVVAATPALADEFDTLTFSASLNVNRDDNTFRLPKDLSPEVFGASAERGDTITSTTVGIAFDKRWSLQRLRLNASMTDNRFSNHGYLGYRADNADGRFDWSLTPQLTGRIAGGRSQTLNSFADYRHADANINTIDRIEGGLEYGGLGPWRLFAGGDKARNTNSQVFLETGDTDNTGAHAGVKYVSAAGNSLGYRLRSQKVDWLHRPLNLVLGFDTSARETRHEILFGLKPMDKTELEGSVGRVKRRHDNVPLRDFDGTAGQLTARWLPTAKLRFDLQATRNLRSWWTNGGSYTVTDTLALSPSWQIDSKIALRGHIEHSEREFSGNAIAQGSASQRLDRSDSLGVALDWQPWRLVGLSFHLNKSRRNSNQPGFDFDNLTTGLTVQFSY
jgi:exopolysaccharide biosynthesis operon protein EpsL